MRDFLAEVLNGERMENGVGNSQSHDHFIRGRWGHRSRCWGLAFACASVTACSTDSIAGREQDQPAAGFNCTFPLSELYVGAQRDAIPFVSDPALLAIDHPDLWYLKDDDRVISVNVRGTTLAVPLNVLWYHEIVNLSVGELPLAVTHCPLTGSSLVFDRGPLGGVEFGVSGLLYQTNLVMYDRVDLGSESFWPQMARGAECGPATGRGLDMLPSVQMRWSMFKELYPNGLVVKTGEVESGVDRSYEVYPYGPNYRDLNNPSTGAVVVDPRRPPKELVLGVPTAGGGVAVPFGSLSDSGAHHVVTFSEEDLVVLWDAAAEAAMAYRPMTAGGQRLTLQATHGGIQDNETGSVWRVDGEASSGPLSGERLQPFADAYVAYWFAWAAFNPSTAVWSP